MRGNGYLLFTVIDSVIYSLCTHANCHGICFWNFEKAKQLYLRADLIQLSAHLRIQAYIAVITDSITAQLQTIPDCMHYEPGPNYIVTIHHVTVKEPY